MRDRDGPPKLPDGAEAALRVRVSSLETQFALYAAGAGNAAVFCASLRVLGRDAPPTGGPLPPGEWATALHLLERCGFWSLTADGVQPFNPAGELADDSWLTIECRVPGRSHRVSRHGWHEWGLDALSRWAFRVSGLYVRQPAPDHFWRPRPLRP